MAQAAEACPDCGQIEDHDENCWQRTEPPRESEVRAVVALRDLLAASQAYFSNPFALDNGRWLLVAQKEAQRCLRQS